METLNWPTLWGPKHCIVARQEVPRPHEVIHKVHPDARPVESLSS